MIFCVLVIVGLTLVFFGYVEYSNRNYAEEYFSDKFKVDSVVASKKWHNATFGCTYAIVIRGDNPTEPWGPGWSQTPYVEQASSDTYFPEILRCLQEVSPNLYQDTTSGLNTEGSWYLRVGSGVLLYTSSKSGIAMRIRYGD